MNNLLNIYENTIPKTTILQRKVSIIDPFTILSGATKSGKTYLIYDYLSQYEPNKYLYINLHDIRIIQEDIFEFLAMFIVSNNIEVLVLENFDFNFDLEILYSLKSIIITPNKEYKQLKNFSELSVMPLDFEEYILFDNKHQNTVNSFNSFFKYGNFPEIIQIDEPNKLIRNQEVIKLITTNQTQFEILKLLIKNSGELKSIFQLFNIMKKYFKISKDLFYESCQLFEQQSLIYFCPKYEVAKAPKKVFCYNHALLDAVSLNKNFNNLFSTMIFLELNKLYEEIYYLDNIDFYIEEDNSVILSIPFFNDFSVLSAKILPIIEKYNISNITIVTISTNKTTFIDDIECEILPFYEWALTL